MGVSVLAQAPLKAAGGLGEASLPGNAAGRLGEGFLPENAAGRLGKASLPEMGLTETASRPCLSDDISQPSIPAAQCAPLG